ncbi:copper fist DNA binding domain-containing protein [Boletus edulis BED1]|uniref:Copper fist DNA binding domain-containing protein n=1 Tax=Boletus edulis BED1 TaxID=1328754 RepID=A0AAD4GJU5_BOLED|nr:copper fist DNA binding domain-containing protein [Boletus edulis BED1]
MVFVNEKKFACEACIKGHRSSSCHHTERPLFEVKKKGRPVSQCPKCRELRQAKRVHSKCTCTPHQPSVDKVPIPAARPDRKPRRFMPSVPTLPNGISDAFQPTPASPPNARQRVDSLLNPCHCKNVRQCTCRRASCISGPSSLGERCSNYGLHTLAEAAAMSCGRPAQDSTSEHSSDPPTPSCCPDELLRPDAVTSTCLELPPILEPVLSTSVPEFPIPPLSTIKSIAGSGCTCGFNCTCPGCIEHRTLRHTEKHHKDCDEGCNHCVDRTAGIELPDQDASSRDVSLVDAFFARAAALPNPPFNRRTELDPGDITVYPCELFGSSTETDERGVAFGLVKVPRLECCRGQCHCPADGCQCGQSCSGGCLHGDTEQISFSPF